MIFVQVPSSTSLPLQQNCQTHHLEFVLKVCPCTGPRVTSNEINVILKYAMKFVVFFHRKPVSRKIRQIK